ncbi:MAG: hypothetical protein HQK49_05165 [Oligoflexia bacterium]|nr:hypothetical protein [Oligoflexia bacterium]
MDSIQCLELNNLSYKVAPIHLREIIFLNNSPCDLFGIIDGFFTVVISKNSLINRDNLKKIVELGLNQIFVKIDDHPILYQLHRKKLIDITRSLSMGNTLENCKKQIYYQLINLEYLYKNPIDDEGLFIQYQCLTNLGQILFDKSELIPPLYNYLLEQKYHYSLSHPILSSLLLLGYLRNVQQFSSKEVLSLFVTSYFKDIGMSAIPEDFLNKSVLTKSEIDIISKHVHFSVEILNSRIPLGANYFNIIENHHAHSLIQDKSKRPKIISGVETLLIESIDTLTAMISNRPYREGLDVYLALNLLKNRMGSSYYQEFKLLVFYIQKFFKSIK